MLSLGITITALLFQTAMAYPQFDDYNRPSIHQINKRQNLQDTIDSIFPNPNKSNNQQGFKNQQQLINNQQQFNNNNNNQQQSSNNNQQQFNNNNNSPTTPGTTTTALPLSMKNCIQQCVVTSQYSPVCGSNGQTYNNMSAFRCAVACGLNISLTREGPCARRGK